MRDRWGVATAIVVEHEYRSSTRVAKIIECLVGHPTRECAIANKGDDATLATPTRHLASKFGDAPPTAIQFYTLKPLVPDCAVVLSALANVGSNALGEIQKAFAAGAPYLRAPANVPLELLSPENCGVEQLDAALNRIAQAVPIIKKNLIEASARVIGADGVIQEAEAELLRAIADALDCPLPPLGVTV